MSCTGGYLDAAGQWHYAVPKMTHSGTGPQRFEIGSPQESVTITFPETSGYIISALDYADFKLMLAEWRAQRESK